MRPDQFVDVIVRRATDTVSSLRRQIPAARMVGEFAVKHLAKEAEKITRRFSHSPQDPDTGHAAPNDS